MHLFKYEDHNDPHPLCVTGNFFRISAEGIGKSREISMGRQKEREELPVAIKIFINSCKLMVIYLLWRYDCSLFAYEVWAIVTVLIQNYSFINDS